MIKRKLATFMLTLMLVMTGVSMIKVISYAQEESAGSSTNPQERVTEYKYSAESDPQNGVVLKVEWNEPKLGENTTFHVSADGGSGRYLFRMDAPSYSNPDEYSFESVADPSRGAWIQYTDECESHDFEFTMTASGVYNFRFYVMDKTSGVYYMRVSTNIQVSDRAYPSVGDIVNAAVKKCSKDTDGSDYEKALWLHDWLLKQLDYDHSLKWSSAESALTRKLGTCQAYESAYSKLLTAAGITNAETRDTYDGHTWNAMKLDGKWYQVDCTWDDTKDNYYNFDQTHLYFGLTDELMALAHNGHDQIYTASGYGTRSTSLADNYFVRNGDAAKWARAYAERIQKNLNAGKTKFEVSTDNASYPPSISGIQNGIIAYALNQMTWKAGSKKVALRVAGTSTKLSFTAKYTDTVKRVRIVFAPNGGRVSSGSKIVICGKTYGTLPTPAKRGYTFAGWNTQLDGKGTFYEENAYVKNLTKKADEVVTLYAQWKAAQYQITYNLNGGKNNKKNPKTYKITSKTIKLSNPSKKGYVFKGWYCDKKCTKKVTSIKKGSTGKVTLYAKWAKEKYTITYKLNGGKNNKKNPKIYTITSKMIKLAAPTRKGYVFKGWYRDKKCTRKVTSIKKGSTGKITLYAKWKKK